MAVIFIILWSNAMIEGLTKKIPGVIGFELLSVSLILTGMVYGAVFTFLFGFFVVPFMNAARWLISMPYEPEWPPGVPSPDSAVAGIMGVAAHYLITIIPIFTLVVLIVMIIRIPLVVMIDTVLYGSPFKPGYIFGIPLTIILAHLFSFVLIL